MSRTQQVRRAPRGAAQEGAQEGAQDPAQSGTPSAASNVVRLRGRVTSAAVERELPSGDTVLGLRIVVPRSRTPMTSGSRQRSDWVECAVWGGRVRRSAATWKVGDLVEVEGALRRRFFRGDPAGGGRGSSRLEVEVLTGRRVAGSGVAKVAHDDAHPGLG